MLDLKPIYNTGTITFIESPEKVSLKKIDSSYIRDPKGIIPNGIYKVFKHEKNKQNFLICFLSTILLAISIWIILISTIFFEKTNKFWFIPAAISFILASWKLISVILDTKHLNISINLYRESIVAGSRLTPPFVSNMYLKLFKSQTRQNWIVIAFLFYGIIFTLLFWWLKDVNWWIFRFKDWIKAIANNPENIGFVLISILIITLVLHIYFTIYRKKRIIDIQSFFGNEVISQVEIDEMVRNKNKLYAKIFFMSILIILIFPFLGWIIYKKFIKK
ncbi:MAG: hypothetical protein HDR43_02175 [Mycoplasma sp.]|nr:hypothetical protein [Mycoplasma sp.]